MAPAPRRALEPEGRTHPGGRPGPGLRRTFPLPLSEAEFKNFQVDTNEIALPLARASTVPETLQRRLQASVGDDDPELMEELQRHGVAGQGALKQRAQRLEQEAKQLRRLAMALHRH